MITAPSAIPSRSRRVRLNGFTLLEMMVVITVIGIMIGMAVPRFGQLIEQSRANFATANLRVIWAAQRLYWLENHVYNDKLSQQSPLPLGLVELGLLDRETVSTSGDYEYSITSADSEAFQATATRITGAAWAGQFTIDQMGTLAGAISAAGQIDIAPGFQ